VSDLTAERPPLDLDRLVSPVDWSVEVVEAAPSTNALVAERARSGAAGEGLVVVAEHQTAGRGRLDRTWETPARSALTLVGAARPEGGAGGLAVAPAAHRVRRCPRACASSAPR
jgi:BirA family biotin operon repressor/biotin-[acetyl-CoA-carboxylase] ligase